MPYTIEKARPPKKEKKENEEVLKKTDPLYAIFGDYNKILNNKEQK